MNNPAAPACAHLRLTPATQWLEQWDSGQGGGAPALSSAGCSSNIFASGWMLAAGLRALADDHVQVAEILAADGRLLCRMPLERRTRFGRLPMQHLAVWSHPNSFLSPIWIDADAGHKALETCLPQLANQPWARGAIVLAVDCLAADDPARDALVRAARALDLAYGTDHSEQRAAIHGPITAEHYWQSSVRSKKRKELRRQSARLAELGTLNMHTARHGEDVELWLQQFLLLEQQGWKGAAGSALACAPATTQFICEAAEQASARGQFFGLTLLCDDAPIAMLALLADADRLWSFKTAYDEQYARYSPGVLLQRAALDLIEEGNFVLVDSCAAADHPMIDSLWRERREIQSLSVALPGRRKQLTYHAARMATRCWHRIKTCSRRQQIVSVQPATVVPAGDEA